VISPADDELPDDPFDQIFDEDFVRAAAFTEPAARVRVRADRWRQLDLAELRPQPLRQRPPTPAPTLPGGRGRRAVAVVVVLLALAVGVSRFGKPEGGPPSAASPAPVAAANPDARFFAGSPAARYASGADAIVPPVARAVGGYSAQTVARAYDVAKQVLVDTNLDRAVRYGATPRQALSLLDPKATKDGVALPDWLRGGLAHPDAGHDPTSLVSRVEQDRVVILGHTIKVEGAMTAGVDAQGSLRIVAHYLFVYPVGKPDGSAAPTRMVADRTVAVWIGPGDVAAPSGYRIDWGGVIFNNRCFVHDGFLHPAFDDSRPYPGGDGADPYRVTPSSAPPRAVASDSCGHAARI
jgi:hypothetical protein